MVQLLPLYCLHCWISLELAVGLLEVAEQLAHHIEGGSTAVVRDTGAMGWVVPLCKEASAVLPPNLQSATWLRSTIEFTAL